MEKSIASMEWFMGNIGVEHGSTMGVATTE